MVGKTKKKNKKKVSSHSVLNEALGDVSKELSKLKKNKISLSTKLGKLESDIVNAQNSETKLRDRISKLIAKESELNKSKGISQAKLLRTKEKIAKIKKIQEELRDI